LDVRGTRTTVAPFLGKGAGGGTLRSAPLWRAHQPEEQGKGEKAVEEEGQNARRQAGFRQRHHEDNPEPADGNDVHAVILLSGTALTGVMLRCKIPLSFRWLELLSTVKGRVEDVE